MLYMDRLSRERRSRLMRRVKSKNTTPEIKVRSIVHRLGFRFRIHYNKLPGKPDIAFPGRRKVIFVHGCFWHGHHNCSKGRLPKSNLSVWRPKIEKNRLRDSENVLSLAAAGWETLVVWQCQLSDVTALTSRITSFLNDPNN